MKILVLNGGSSSLKSSLFKISDTDSSILESRPLWQQEIEYSATKEAYEDKITNLLTSLWSGHNAPISDPAEIAAVGHRVVHGGTNYNTTTLVNDQVITDLQSLIPLAPTHEPINIQGIEIAKQVFKTIPQVAVFDTAFHSSMPETAIVYPCPYEWYEKFGIRRFGFHGISHLSCSQTVAKLLKRELSSLKIINLSSW